MSEEEHVEAEKQEIRDHVWLEREARADETVPADRVVGARIKTRNLVQVVREPDGLQRAPQEVDGTGARHTESARSTEDHEHDALERDRNRRSDVHMHAAADV